MIGAVVGSLGRAWRRTGADLPVVGDPRPTHGAEMEGWFWRFTDAATDRVAVALCGINRHRDGDWATVAVALHPGGVVRSAAVDGAWASPDRFEVRAGDVLRADADGVEVRLDAVTLSARLADRRDWPLALGGGGVFSAVPFLGQYWHPHVLGASVSGTVSGPDGRWDLAGATAYAEKNWGAGFPRRWWWGQAQAFDAGDACVVFSGGVLTAGPLAATVGGAVVRLGDEVLRFTPPTALVRSSAEPGRWEVRARSATHDLHLVGEPAGTEPHVLPVPLPAERRNVDTDLEHLAGTVTCTLRRRGRLRFHGRSALAGLEVGALPGTDPWTGAPLGHGRLAGAAAG